MELKRRYNLTFGLEELFGVYQVRVHRDYDRWYLSCRSGYDEFLINHMLDSEEWVSIYVLVTGNFIFEPSESPKMAVQFRTGTHGQLISRFKSWIYLLSFMHMLIPYFGDLLQVKGSCKAIRKQRSDP